MENSNCGCDCPFVKQGFCETDKHCPFYQESWWSLANKDNPTPKLVKDCFPKKFGFQINNLELRFLALQASVVETRNQVAKLTEAINQMIQLSSNVQVEIKENSLKLSHNESLKQIE